jgi:hypothetical protein
LTKAFRTYKKQPGLQARSKGYSAGNMSKPLPSMMSASQIEPGEFVGFLGPTAPVKPRR